MYVLLLRECAYAVRTAECQSLVSFRFAIQRRSDDCIMVVSTAVASASLSSLRYMTLLRAYFFAICFA